MISDEKIREGYLKRFGRPMLDPDLISFKRFVFGFEADHYETFDEMQNAILISIHTMSEDIDECETAEERKNLIEKKLAWTRR